MATANASGDFQLPLVFIHKSAKPLCFSGINVFALPVHYNCQKSGWMDSLIFKDWFNKHFIATVTKYLESKSLSPQALLLLDNVPSILLYVCYCLLMVRLNVCFYHPMSQA